MVRPGSVGHAADGLAQEGCELAAPVGRVHGGPAVEEQFGHGRSALVAVVLGQLVHVHLDEAVGDGCINPAAELERVLERVGRLGREPGDGPVEAAGSFGPQSRELVAQFAARLRGGCAIAPGSSDGDICAA